MELNKKEIWSLLTALDWYYDYVEDDDMDEIFTVVALKEKLKLAYKDLTKED